MSEFSDAIKRLEESIEKKFDLFKGELASTKSEIKEEISASSTQLAESISNMRKIIIDNLVRENQTLQKTVQILFERLVKTERQVNLSEQNNRKNNLEISGIPVTVDDANLKSVVTKILNHAAVSDITENDIEAVHRLPGKTSPLSTIVRMRRNLVDEVKELDNKKKLKTAPSLLNFPAGTSFYVNDNLSPTMRNLAFNARQLKKKGVIADTWFANAAVRIRTHDKRVLKITHEMDLFDHFPDFTGFTFDTFLYERDEDGVDIDRYDTLEGSWDMYYPENLGFQRTSLRTPETTTPKPNIPPKPTVDSLPSKIANNVTIRSRLRSLNLNPEGNI